MPYWLLELLAALPLLGLVWLARHGLGVAARKAGTGRLHIAALIALMGMVMGH